MSTSTSQWEKRTRFTTAVIPGKHGASSATREVSAPRVHIHCCHLKTCTHLSETEIPEEFRSSSLFPVICFNGEIIPLHTAFGKKPQRVLRYTKRSKFYSLGRCIKAPKVVFVKHTCGESAHNWWFYLLA